jgi:hypothetical protein
MSTARHWTALHLTLAWVSVFAVLGPLRWLLQAGVYTAALEGGRVRRLSGAWSAGFALNAWLLCAAVSIGVMDALTATWINGRSARASLRAAEAAVHRQVLK